MTTTSATSPNWPPQRFSSLRHPAAGDTVLYLVRHGRTSANHRQVLQGATDHPLDDFGLRQAALVADRFAQVDEIDALVTSPLQRAATTARLIGHRIGREPIVVPGLREFDFGAYENRTFDDLLADRPDVASRMLDLDDFDVGWPGGETRRGFYDRVRHAFEAILHDYHKHRVIVVAHGGVLGAFLGMIQGVSLNDLRHYDLKNCSLTELRVTNRETVVHLRNDVCHLEELREQDVALGSMA